MGITPNNALLNLTGKRAIVTGGAVGIGRGIVYRLAEAGAKVLVADISQEHLDDAKQYFAEFKFDVTFIKTDVSQEKDIQAMCAAAVEAFGGVDILVNNAGIYPSKLVLDMTPEDFDKVLAVNVKSAFLATKAVSQQMIKQGDGGHIINITSIDALHPSSIGLAHYDTSKHGLWGFTKNSALELAPHKIWVNAVAPGGIVTPGVQAMQQAVPQTQNIDTSKTIERFLQRIPMHRMGEPDDIGKVVIFLASDMASYLTGSQIVVDGGVLLA